MKDFLENYLKINKIPAEVFECNTEVHTAAKAAAQLKGDKNGVAKSILLIGPNEEPVLVILLGIDKINFQNVKDIMEMSDVRLAYPEEVVQVTGYEVGGVPPISIYGVSVIIDSAVVEKEEVVCGGGDPHHLMRIKVKYILESNEDALIKDVKK